MVEPDIAVAGLPRERLTGLDFRDKHHDPAELHIDALAPVGLNGFDDFGAEHALIIARGLFRVGAAQMDMVVSEFGHRSILHVGRSENVDCAGGSGEGLGEGLVMRFGLVPPSFSVPDFRCAQECAERCAWGYASAPGAGIDYRSLSRLDTGIGRSTL